MQQKFSIVIILLLILSILSAVFLYLGFKPAPLAITTPKFQEVRKNFLDPNQQEALHTPLHSASAEEKIVHAEVVAKLAQDAPRLIIIAGCKPNPLVYRVNLNGSFNVKNNDAVPHALRYLTMQIALPAQSTTTIKTSQWFKTSGEYGYGCDNLFAKAGVFMVR